jgi:hypothetical protein
MSELVHAFPLARDERGQQLEVPSEARRWIVRRKQPGRGAPALVRIGGEPLYLDLGVTYEQFVEAVDGVPGVYRLDLVDDYGRLVAGAPSAYTEIGNGAQYPSGMDPVPVLVALVEKQHAQLVQQHTHFVAVVEKQNAQIAKTFEHQSTQLAAIADKQGSQLVEAIKLLTAQNAQLHAQLAAQSAQLAQAKLPQPRNTAPADDAPIVIDDGRVHWSALAYQALKTGEAVAQATAGGQASQAGQILGAVANLFGQSPPESAPPPPFSPPGAPMPPQTPPAAPPGGPPPGAAPPPAAPTAPPSIAFTPSTSTCDVPPPPHVDERKAVSTPASDALTETQKQGNTDHPNSRALTAPPHLGAPASSWYPLGPPAQAGPTRNGTVGVT